MSLLVEDYTPVLKYAQGYYSKLPMIYELGDISAGIPRTTFLGVSRVQGEDGIIHQKQYADLDGDGDVDVDWWFLNKAYFGAEREFHFRILPNSSQPGGGTETGRLVTTADASYNYILSGVNYSGSSQKSLVIGRYNGPSTPFTTWAIFDKTTARTTLVSLTVSTPTPPASASATGTAGQIEWDTGFVYVCTATNTWKRAALSTW
jgi:hypothetical protein